MLPECYQPPQATVGKCIFLTVEGILLLTFPGKITTAQMKKSTISRLRLTNQHIGGSRLNTVKDVVSWMGAIQAQDYTMSKYGIGVRLENCDDRCVENAINNGDIFRIHVLRPTWHFVAGEDIRWMMNLTANNLKRALASNYKRLELDDKTFRKVNTTLERLLRDEQHLTRKDIMAVLARKGIKTNELRSLHIMFHAETDLVVCNGIRRDREFTYALFDERVPPSREVSREEALARLAERYFISHGPATIGDFTWWSGLSITEAKKALELVKKDLMSERLDSYTFWFSANLENSKRANNKLVLLPSFDEFLISYKSREISINNIHFPQAITSNGIFRPIIFHKSKVIGTWKPFHKKEMIISSHFFEKPTDQQKRLFAKAAEKFVQFIAG